MFKRTPLFLLTLLCLIAIGCSESDQPAKQKKKRNVFPIPTEVIDKGAKWETVAQGFTYTDSPAADQNGNVYFADVVSGGVLKLNVNDEIEEFASDGLILQGLAFGEDGYLYGCRSLDGQIVRYDSDGLVEVLASGEPPPRGTANEDRVLSHEFCNDLAVNPAGGLWFTDRENNRIQFLDVDGGFEPVYSGFRANGIQLSRDKSKLFVSDSNSLELHAFEIGENGALSKLPGYFEPIKISAFKAKKVSDVRPGNNGLTVDGDGRVYVATFIGVQVFSEQGAHIGIIPPMRGYMSNLAFGGANMDQLFATGTMVFRRMPTKVRGLSQIEKVSATDIDN